MTRSSAAQRDDPDATRERIKAAAQRLFSRRGIDGVPVRDIVAEAGLRNGASLHYYFGSKDGLIRALVIDGARHSDTARHEALDEMERAGGPGDVLDITRLLVDVETAPRGPALPHGFGHMRFIVALQIHHRHLMHEALEGHRNTGYLRCLGHLRRLLPEVPREILNQRFIFMYITLTTALAAREAAFESDPTGGKLWSSPEALKNLAQTLAAGLKAPWA